MECSWLPDVTQNKDGTVVFMKCPGGVPHMSLVRRRTVPAYGEQTSAEGITGVQEALSA